MSVTIVPGPSEFDTMDNAVPFGTVGVWHTQSQLNDLSCFGAVCSYPLGKPQNVGDCGWIRCPRNCVLSHVAINMACSWLVAVASYEG